MYVHIYVPYPKQSTIHPDLTPPLKQVHLMHCGPLPADLSPLAAERGDSPCPKQSSILFQPTTIYNTETIYPNPTRSLNQVHLMHCGPLPADLSPLAGERGYSPHPKNLT